MLLLLVLYSFWKKSTITFLRWFGLVPLPAPLCQTLFLLTFFGLTPVLAIRYPHSLPLGLYWHLIALGILLGLFGRLYQLCTLNLKNGIKKLAFYHVGSIV